MYVIHQQQGLEVRASRRVSFLSLHIPPPFAARDRDNLPPTSRPIALLMFVRINYINLVCFLLQVSGFAPNSTV